MRTDIGERRNEYFEHPEIACELSKLLADARAVATAPHGRK